jgi:hypothetical protein
MLSVAAPDMNNSERSLDDNSCPRTSKQKKKKVSNQIESSSSSVESDADGSIRGLKAKRTPLFSGRRIPSSATTNQSASDMIERDHHLKAMEQKYFLPLSIAQERLENMMKSLYKSQMKIQKALQKQKVSFKVSKSNEKITI